MTSTEQQRALEALQHALTVEHQAEMAELVARQQSLIDRILATFSQSLEQSTKEKVKEKA